MCSFTEAHRSSHCGILVQDHWWHWFFRTSFKRPDQHSSLNPWKTARETTAKHVWWRRVNATYFSRLAHFAVQCIMQQATWQNTMSPKQMTFGVIWEVGHKFNRGKAFSVNSGLANGGFFFFGLLQLGVLQRMLPPCPSLRETILGWRRRDVCSVPLCRAPQAPSHTNFTIITRTRLLDAI